VLTNNDRRVGVLVACFAATLYLALLVAAFGIISLVTDAEVIVGPSRGLFLGPAMVAATVVAVLLEFVVSARFRPAVTSRVSVVRAISIGLVAYLSYLVAGGVLVAVGTGTVAAAVFVGQIALTPFAAAVAILATLTTIVSEVAIAYRSRNRDRPRWPWERDI